MAVTRGAGLMTPDKLRPNSPTNRMVASCCNTAMLVNFDRGPHWVSVYRNRIVGDAPPIEMRVQTRFKRPEVTLSADIPAYAFVPVSFVARLVGARIAMLFGR